MGKPVPVPSEIFNQIDSVSICKNHFIRWCKTTSKEDVESLQKMLGDKHSTLAIEARKLQDSGASESDIEAALYELMYFMNMYQTVAQVLDAHHALN